MKRKFSFSSLRIKKSPAAEESSPIDGIDSPPYSPIPSVMERARIPSHLEKELYRSCAIIVRETNPTGDDDDDHHQEALRKYKAEREAQKALVKPRAAKHDSRSSSFFIRHRDEPRQPAPKISTYTHIPKNAAASHEATATGRLPPFNFEPLEPTHTKSSAATRSKRPDSDDPLTHIRAALDLRPKTSAAACVDYTGPSADTSLSTSCSTTTYDDRGCPTSTGVTSLALSPSEDKRSSYLNTRISEQILQDGTSASLADATAKAWMQQELARRRAEHHNCSIAARPESRGSMQPKQQGPGRPLSRAGSIAGSVRDGIRDYIRPRASMDSVRGSRSEIDLTRTTSRSSSIKGGNGSSWWRGNALRRKGSWSSFRSGKPDEDEQAKAASGESGPNLNRALPALPGLDQYKEKKAMPTHIAQLMRGGRAASEKKQREPATIIDDDGLERTLSQSEERKRQEGMYRAVQEKMNNGVMGTSERSTHRMSQGHSHQRSLGRPSMTTYSSPSVTVLGAPEQTEKKRGLKKKLTRFWSMGGDKAMGGGRKGFGKMVVAN